MSSIQTTLKRTWSLVNGRESCGNGSSGSLLSCCSTPVDALAIMTISDSLVNPDEDTTAEERQNTFTDMMKVGLETLIAD